MMLFLESQHKGNLTSLWAGKRETRLLVHKRPCVLYIVFNFQEAFGATYAHSATRSLERGRGG